MCGHSCHGCALPLIEPDIFVSLKMLRGYLIARYPLRVLLKRGCYQPFTFFM